MVYIEYDGYITHLASSPDLLAWKPLGVILKRTEKGWDAQQAAASIALQAHAWGGSDAYPPFNSLHPKSKFLAINEVRLACAGLKSAPHKPIQP